MSWHSALRPVRHSHSQQICLLGLESTPAPIQYHFNQTNKKEYFADKEGGEEIYNTYNILSQNCFVL